MLYKKIRFRQLKYQLIFQGTLTIFLLIIFLAVIIYIISVRIQINEVMRYNNIMVRQISKSLDDYFQSFQQVVDRVTFNKQIQSLLKTPYKSDKERYSLDAKLLSEVTNETLLTEQLDSIYIYDNKGLRLQLNRSVSNSLNPERILFNQISQEKSGKIKITGDRTFIAASRRIFDVYGEDFIPIGYLIMTVQPEYIIKRIQEFQEGEQRYILVLDKNDHLVVSTLPEVYIKNKEFLSHINMNGSNMNTIKEIPSMGDMVVTTYKSEETGWKIISLVSLEELSKGPALIQKSILGIGLLAIGLGVLITIASANHIVRPLQELSRIMDEVEKENFYVQINIHRNDELGRVGESFNKMMKKINELILQVYEREISEKEAQLKALQAQINPHFLYNTLDAINWMAKFGETDQVSQMTISLSRLLKKTISNNRSFVTVKEELDTVQDYLNIQRIRFRDKLEYQILIEPNVYHCFVPNFIIQPIVENAMIHGIEKKMTKGSLTIKGWIEQEKLFITVSDDGVGINREKLQSILNDTLQHPGYERRGNGSGINNVKKRIQLLYGGTSELSIESLEGKGTTVKLCLPVIKEECADVQNPYSR